MGNVVSAMLMYALQAAWWCQRMLDQDYRQNHGSRISPMLDSKADEIDILLPDLTTAILARSPHHRSHLARRRLHDEDGEGRARRRASSFRTTPTNELKRKPIRQQETDVRHHMTELRHEMADVRQQETEVPNEEELTERLALDESFDARRNTSEYVSQVRRHHGLRRAFSEANITNIGVESRTLRLVGSDRPSDFCLYSLL